MLKRSVIYACATASALAVGAMPAAAQQPPDPPSVAEASVALDHAQEALGVEGAPSEPSGGVESAPDATVALNGLAAALPELRGGERRRARGLLARPTDGAADQFGDGYQAGAPVASVESPHFCVFWVNDPASADAPNLADANGNGRPDYVEAILAIAEFSYSIEVAPGAMGWAPPKPDVGGCGANPGAHADIYLKQLGDKGFFGYESPDPGQGRDRSQYGYVVLDNDYAPSEYGVFLDPLDPAEVTFAHEFNHLLQQNYDSFQDVWMFESTAVWTEEQVYPEINDYINYVPSFASGAKTPITDRKASKGLRIYGSGVWNHWLSSRLGVGVIRRAWEVSDVARPADYSLAAYDRAIRDAGGKGFEREFIRFVAATAEWRAGHGSFPDATAYPDVERDGTLRRGQRKRFELDHTGYRLLKVKSGGRSIELKVDAERGVRAGIALVARDGDELAGSVTEKSKYLPTGGRASVTLSKPGSFERITAVVVNADGRVKGFRNTDWVYAKDNQRFTARLTR
ncbi:MAG: hypothetical protein GEU88_17660 [Solirubrobacterales bacterium]|nr:hypothetical protein [Solirubrobacterales bacterium]